MLTTVYQITGNLSGMSPSQSLGSQEVILRTAQSRAGPRVTPAPRAKLTAPKVLKMSITNTVYCVVLTQCTGFSVHGQTGSNALKGKSAFPVTSPVLIILYFLSQISYITDDPVTVDGFCYPAPPTSLQHVNMYHFICRLMHLARGLWLRG